jgi:tRNA (cmo5U34)-methyltransferase
VVVERVLERHAEAEGFAERCSFHVGTVSSLAAAGFDAATSVLVSHFLTDPADSQAYYGEIRARLKRGGRFFDAALCAERTHRSFDVLMGLWLAQGMAEERRPAFRAMFGVGVAARGPAEVEALLAAAGFTSPVPVFQATLVRAWVTTRE